MRYEAYGPDKYGEWGVDDQAEHNQHRDRYEIFRGSEAEAKIIAFALNAVAEGKRLFSPTFEAEDGMFRYGGEYLGPTHGVAPEGKG